MYGKWPEQFSKVFSIEKSTQNFEKYSSGTGFGIAKDIAEGEEIGCRSLLVKKEFLNTEKLLTGNAEDNSKQAGFISVQPQRLSEIHLMFKISNSPNFIEI